MPSPQHYIIGLNGAHGILSFCCILSCYSHLSPEGFPENHGVRVAELPLEPDKQPAETEIQVTRLLQIQKYKLPDSCKYKNTDYRTLSLLYQKVFRGTLESRQLQKTGSTYLMMWQRSSSCLFMPPWNRTLEFLHTQLRFAPYTASICSLRGFDFLLTTPGQTRSWRRPCP